MKEGNMEELVVGAQNHDLQAQNDLIEAVQQDAYYFCKKLLKNEQDAEDATQDILITVLTKLDTLKEPAAFKGWLRQICSNRCKNKLTRGPKEAQIPEDEEGNSLLDTFEDMDNTVVPQEALEDMETKRIIREIVDELPPAQTECILMFYYDDMSVKDIAATLGIPENTVKSRLNYGRKTIKAGIETAEKRDGIKLHGIAPLALLRPFFQSEAASTALEESKAAAMVKAALEAGEAAEIAAAAGTTGTSAAATTASTVASGVAAGVAKGISVKVIAAVIVGIVAVSGVGAFVGTQFAAWNQENSPAVASFPESSEPVEEAVVPTASPTTAPTPSPTPSPTPTPTPTPSPTPMPEPVPVELSEDDVANVNHFVSNFLWYGNDYDWRNSTDPIERKIYEYSVTNLLEALLCPFSCIDYSLYLDGVEVKDLNGIAEYVPGRTWLSHNGRGTVLLQYQAKQIDWILKNIFNCSDADIAVLRANLRTETDDACNTSYYYSDDHYYCTYEQTMGYGVSSWTIRSEETVQYGHYIGVKSGLYSYNFGSDDADYVNSIYSVFEKKESDGQTYWSLYYSSLEPFTDWDALS